MTGNEGKCMGNEGKNRTEKLKGNGRGVQGQ